MTGLPQLELCWTRYWICSHIVSKAVLISNFPGGLSLRRRDYTMSDRKIHQRKFWLRIGQVSGRYTRAIGKVCMGWGACSMFCFVSIDKKHFRKIRLGGVEIEVGGLLLALSRR